MNIVENQSYNKLIQINSNIQMWQKTADINYFLPHYLNYQNLRPMVPIMFMLLVVTFPGTFARFAANLLEL